MKLNIGSIAMVGRALYAASVVLKSIQVEAAKSAHTMTGIGVDGAEIVVEGGIEDDLLNVYLIFPHGEILDYNIIENVLVDPNTRGHMQTLFGITDFEMMIVEKKNIEDMSVWNGRSWTCGKFKLSVVERPERRGFPETVGKALAAADGMDPEDPATAKAIEQNTSPDDKPKVVKNARKRRSRRQG